MCATIENIDYIFFSCETPSLTSDCSFGFASPYILDLIFFLFLTTAWYCYGRYGHICMYNIYVYMAFSTKITSVFSENPMYLPLILIKWRGGGGEGAHVWFGSIVKYPHFLQSIWHAKLKIRAWYCGARARVCTRSSFLAGLRRFSAQIHQIKDCLSRISKKLQFSDDRGREGRKKGKGGGGVGGYWESV